MIAAGNSTYQRAAILQQVVLSLQLQNLIIAESLGLIIDLSMFDGARIMEACMTTEEGLESVGNGAEINIVEPVEEK